MVGAVIIMSAGTLTSRPIAPQEANTQSAESQTLLYVLFQGIPFHHDVA